MVWKHGSKDNKPVESFPRGEFEKAGFLRTEATVTLYSAVYGPSLISEGLK